VKFLKQAVNDIFENLFVRYPRLVSCKEDIEKAFSILQQCYGRGGKVLLCGNGGSAADCEHIVGELMKGFMLKRDICTEDTDKIKKAFPEDSEFLIKNLQGALPAISLVSQSAISSAFINDVSAEMVFAQQVYGYLKDGDVVIGLSTSGNAKNVVNAIKIAKALGAETIGLTGETGGKLKDICTAAIKAPACETYKIQEYHLPIYHALCAMIEAEVFPK
jgi:phosphoheptose isomerase